VLALSKKEIDAAHRFVNNDCEVWKNDANLVFTGRKHPFLKSWLTAFPKSNSGTQIGTFLRDEFLPAQALANTRLASEGVPKVEVSREDALQFLRRESIVVPEKLGWCLITHEQQHLGWGKALGNRFNNYYPNEWRIRQA
jgi:NOL1/NOP2/fmu family ribosome biogenesis protein